MPQGAFHQEIATLLADVVTREAARLGGKTSDKQERRRNQAEYKKLTLSTDWLDQLIVELIGESS